MKQLFFSMIALAATMFVSGQSLSPTVISSTGGYSENANNSLSYTVGEMTMVETFIAPNGGPILTQGFQQPNDIVIGLVDITQDEFGSFVVYPTPAVDNVWFGFQLPEQGKVNVTMFNELGQKIGDVFHTNYDNGKVVQQTNVSTLAAGLYFFTMTFTSEKDNKTHITTKKFQVIN